MIYARWLAGFGYEKPRIQPNGMKLERPFSDDDNDL